MVLSRRISQHFNISEQSTEGFEDINSHPLGVSYPDMFKTKKDVDRHVQDINSKVKSASERNLKGYSIAKLYFAVKFRPFPLDSLVTALH